MKEKVRRYGLQMLAMLPVVAVAFAAKSALNVAQINKGGATNAELAGNDKASHS